MHTNRSRGLMWFRHDLRIADNLALSQLAASVDELLCVFVVDPRWFKAGHYQSQHMGIHRWRFLQQSLYALHQQLAGLGQSLIVLEGQPVEVISALIDTQRINQIAVTSHPGIYERQQGQRLKNTFAEVEFSEHAGHALFTLAQLPFDLVDLPKHFTPFRKRVETLPIAAPVLAPTTLPAPPASLPASIPFDESAVHYRTAYQNYAGFQGGEAIARQQLERFLFGTDHIARYKETRNGLDGWDYSSKLSPWLANGCLSARQVYVEIKRYEAQRQANESTYWLYFELLWREYFQWYLRLHQHDLFHFDGVQKKRPLTSFWPERFAKWCQGKTPYPIVNACMNQLNATGYMSNRGRQLVASCLVHELQLDWRYGAAYFEQQLMDFDVASNWGNWQYLAGVGADPRGHRQFDLHKQSQTYDPQGTFVADWQGQTVVSALDSMDAADWPVSGG